MKTKVTEERFFTFLSISEHLTGFSENELLSTGLHETYYYTIMKELNQDNIRDFLDESQSILDQYPDFDPILLAQIKQRLLPTDRYDGLARKIIILWYTGIWTSNDSKMVSTESYIHGLVWKAAETHPAGAKQPGFASWSKRPL